MQKDIRLSLKREWFELTKSGVKTEDYREINEYWFKRLVYDYKRVFKYTTGWEWKDIDKQSREILIKDIVGDTLKRSMIGFVPFENNIMTLGYPSNTETEKILKYKHGGIEIGTGNPEWGAEEDKKYFVIKHGEKI